MPVLGRNLHHVIDAGIVTNLHLRQTKVRTLARVARHDVIDDGASVRGGHLTHRPKLHLSAEYLIDPSADPVEMPVHARGHVPARYAAGPLDRSRVHRVDPDSLEHPPQVLARQRAEERLTGPRDHRDGVRREPDGRLLDCSPGIRLGEWSLRHTARASELGGNRTAAYQHRLLLQPVDVAPVYRAPAHPISPRSPPSSRRSASPLASWPRRGRLTRLSAHPAHQTTHPLSPIRSVVYDRAVREALDCRGGAQGQSTAPRDAQALKTPARNDSGATRSWRLRASRDSHVVSSRMWRAPRP